VDPEALLSTPLPFTALNAHLVQHVRRVPPGSAMTVGEEKISSHSFMNWLFAKPTPADVTALTRQLRELLFQTVRRQMMSDVPVACS